MTTYLIKLGFTATPFNTVNGWGFGGGVGTSYRHPDGREVRKGTAYFRHLPSQSFLTVTVPGICQRLDIKEKEISNYIES